ncbi:pentapeptide repeat-containing protein [Saccharothrix syringae]|uniref:Pentapeptide repeat-containing protein n=1 Tax=Saccharothrix syringae TaxID=103733 RepID=A0A5Q0HC57_SACSY|nr:pentapeptide repeat-containing protein [Saccharothrix syringae]QFZ23826.1 pentapeptide repeat-containing protein [Saccharothrix syringae]
MREALDVLRPYWPALLALLALIAVRRALRAAYLRWTGGRPPTRRATREERLLTGARGRMAWSVARWLAAAVVLAGATGFGLFVLLGTPRLPSSDSFTTAELLELLKIGLAVVGGLGAVVALAVAYRRQQVSEAAHHIATRQEERERTKFHNERYGAAAEQLGHERFAVRLAGVHAMISLADDWPAQRQICVDVLCAYLRTPVPEDDPNEAEVRQVVLTALLEHEWPNGGAPTVDLRNARLVDLDMANRVFKGTFIFDNARFGGARTSFEGAEFLGRTSFRGAEFTAHRTVFSAASAVRADLDFTGATFAGGSVDFTHARLSEASVHFERVRVDGTAFDFRGTELSGSTLSFRRAHLRDTALSLAHVILGRRLGRVGVLRLSEVDAERTAIDFESCRLVNAVVEVREARFADCRLEHFPTGEQVVVLRDEGAEPAEFAAELRAVLGAGDREAPGTGRA